MIDFEFRNVIGSGFGEEFFREILEKVIETLGLGGLSMEMSLNIVDQEEIQKLNKKYRDKDKPTDVLSFPLQNLDNPISKDAKTHDILALGDLFISLPIAIHKAKEEGKTLEQELQWLTVHGFLHLLGYDHERSSKDEELMFDLQDRILAEL